MTACKLIFALLLLSPGAFAAGRKSGGAIVVSDDLIGAPAGNIELAGGAFLAQGFIGSAAGAHPSGGLGEVESGFYSYLLSSPSAYGYSGVSTGSVLFNWLDSNPAGTDYTLFLSTYAGTDPYLTFLSTPGYAADFSGLAVNTSYYAYLQSNYMESDFPAQVSTVAVTLSSAVPDAFLALNDAGPRSAQFRYASYANPGAVFNTPWAQETQAALPKTLYGHGSARYGGFLYAGGGHDGVSFSSAVYYAAVNSGGGWNSWAVAGYLPSASYGAVMLAAKGRLYSLGGYNSGGAAAQVWSSVVSSSGALGPWRAEAPLSGARYMHAAVLYKGQIYVSGGYSGGADAVVRRAAPGDDGVISAWTAETSLPAPRYGHAMSVYNGFLFVTGGHDGGSARSTVWTAAIEAGGGLGAWQTQSPLPSARYGHRTEIVDGRLIAAGGNNGASAQLLVFGSTISADGSTGVWQAFNSMPSPLQFPALEKIGGKLCLLGGSDGSTPSATVFVSTFAGTEYLAEAASDSGFTAIASSSSWNPDHGWDAAGLTPDSDYYFRVKARNWAGIETGYSGFITTHTYAAVPALSTPTVVHRSSAAVSWAANGNPGGANYYCEISSSPGYVPLTASLSTGGDSAVFTTLVPNTTFYARVRAVDGLSRNSAFLDLPPFKTVFDASLDTSSPTIVDAQAGDQVWRNTGAGVYAVEFHDTGGSGLNKFQVQAATQAGGASGIIAPWTDAAAGIDQDDYVQPWALPPAVWAGLAEGPTNYISVRVLDNVSNSTEVFDAFYVLKDTTPPGISLSYIPPAGWVADNPGPVSSAAFTDAVSGLARAQYSVSSAKLAADGQVIPWTEISPVPGYAVLEATWSYDFTRLVNGSTNYFSLKAVDRAGNETLLADAFTIQKNVSGPVVTISSPTALYLSTSAQVVGYNLETDSRAVTATELSFKDKSTGLYWNGTGFLSSSRFWFVAAGTYPFVYNMAMPLADGGQYEAVARSSDVAGDYSASFATYTFTFDSTPPSLGLVHPADASGVSSENYLSGTAADAGSGVLRVEAAIRRVSDGKWWDPSLSDWTAARAAIRTADSTAWSYDFTGILAASLADGAGYYWTARGVDRSMPANTGAFDVYGATFTYHDIVPPGASDDLAAGPGTNPGSTVLTWTVRGDDGAGGYLLNGGFAVQYSTFAEAAFSTGSASVFISTSGLAAGARAGYTLIGLADGSTGYFSLWTKDDAGNWSAASNLAAGLAGGAAVGTISGRVTQASSQPIQGVLVEAYTAAGVLAGSDATSSEGKYSLPGLGAGKYTIKALWTAEDIASSVSKGGVDCGAAEVNFSLSISCRLAAVSGVIPSGYRPGSGFRASAAASEDSRPYVELFQRGRRIAMAYADGAGRFSLSNLLPGTYSIRVYNGKEFSEPQTVKLKSGELLFFTPKWEVLKKESVYAYPNPARREVSFHFDTSLAVFEAELSVFDIAGRLVKQFSTAEVSNDPHGGYRVHWELAGGKAASGVYIYALNMKDPKTGDHARAIKKFAIIR
ncbi:MAG: carboxypeptidase regulatory-like domain-containing protein [Elusimicrobiales bacterium]|jgi:hypothetical protein